MTSSERVHCSHPIEALTRGPRHHFFGFYDACPWDASERYVLALETDFIDRMPTGREPATVGVGDTSDGNRWHPIAETFAWNFQQANRLQWVPNTDRTLVYNVREGERFAAELHSLDTGERRRLEEPIYALAPDGRSALSIDYARLQRLGGYGYPGVDDPRAGVAAPDDAGIRRIDLANGRGQLLISVAQVAAHGASKASQQSHHYLSHVTFNPQGTRICFLHRFWLADGGFYTRLFTADPDGSDLYCLAEGTLSHFDWFEEDRIMIWGRHRPLVAMARQRNLFALPILKPLLDVLRRQTRGFVRQHVIGDRYLVLTDRSKRVDAIGIGTLTEDGHPTRFPGSSRILTDTYPDEQHYRTLILFDLDRNERTDVGRFYALPDAEHWVDDLGEKWEVSGMRSDLHPRWNRSESRICIDSIHGGSRQMYAVEVGRPSGAAPSRD